MTSRNERRAAERAQKKSTGKREEKARRMAADLAREAVIDRRNDVRGGVVWVYDPYCKAGFDSLAAQRASASGASRADAEAWVRAQMTRGEQIGHPLVGGVWVPLDETQRMLTSLVGDEPQEWRTALATERDDLQALAIYVADGAVQFWIVPFGGSAPS